LPARPSRSPDTWLARRSRGQRTRPAEPPVLRQNPPHTAPSRAPREDAPARPSPTVDRARRVAQPPTQIVSGVRARLLPFCCPTSGVHRGGQELPRRIAGVVLDPSNHRAAHSPICRHFENGSDGTRTRDLRRDRPLRGSLGGRRRAGDPSDHAAFPAVLERFARLSGAVPGACCPIAARGAPLESCVHPLCARQARP
jgi:hypothetical protein